MDPPAQQHAITIQALYDRSARLQSAWTARPANNHPARASWEQKFWQDILALRGTIRKVEGRDTVVPPFVLAFLVEHNAAYTAQRGYDVDALDPDCAPRAFSNFSADVNYRFQPVDGGWWDAEEFAPPPPPAPSEVTQASGADTAFKPVPPRSRAASVQRGNTPPALVPSTGEAPGIRTRSASKAAMSGTPSTDHTPMHDRPEHHKQPQAPTGKKRGAGQDVSSRPLTPVSGGLPKPARPPVSETAAKTRVAAGANILNEHAPGTRSKSAARAQSFSPGKMVAGGQHVRNNPLDSAPGRFTKPARSSQSDKGAKRRVSAETGTPHEDAPGTHTRSVTRVKSSSPPKEGPGPYPQTFDFSGDDVVDHWVPMTILCSDCEKRGLICRVNFLHGAQCNHCTNGKRQCSLVPVDGGGSGWTKEQRVYILYDFQRKADPTAPHPATSIDAQYADNPAFSVPVWFTDKLKALKPSFWAPGGAARMYKPRSTQSKRATFLAPTPDTEREASRAHTPSAPPPKRRKTASGKRQSPVSDEVISSGDSSHNDGHESGEDEEGADDWEETDDNMSDEDVKVRRAVQDPGSQAAAMRTRSKQRTTLVVPAGEHDSTDVDMEEPAEVAGHGPKKNLKKRARGRSKAGKQRDHTTNTSPAQSRTKSAPKRLLHQYSGAMRVPPPTVSWRDMPSLEKQLGLRERLSAVWKSSQASGDDEAANDEASDNQAWTAEDFTPDVDLSFDFHGSVPLAIQHLDQIMTREEADRRVNINFEYIEGQTSSLWDAVTKLEDSLGRGQQKSVRDIEELRACTRRAIADNEALTLRLADAMAKLQQQANDITELKAVVNALRQQQGLAALWESGSIGPVSGTSGTAATCVMVPGNVNTGPLARGVQIADLSEPPLSQADGGTLRTDTPTAELSDGLADHPISTDDALDRPATIERGTRSMPSSDSQPMFVEVLGAESFLPRSLFGVSPPSPPSVPGNQSGVAKGASSGSDADGNGNAQSGILSEAPAAALDTRASCGHSDDSHDSTSSPQLSPAHGPGSVVQPAASVKSAEHAVMDGHSDTLPGLQNESGLPTGPIMDNAQQPAEPVQAANPGATHGHSNLPGARSDSVPRIPDSSNNVGHLEEQVSSATDGGKQLVEPGRAANPGATHGHSDLPGVRSDSVPPIPDRSNNVGQPEEQVSLATDGGKQPVEPVRAANPGATHGHSNLPGARSESVPPVQDGSNDVGQLEEEVFPASDGGKQPAEPVQPANPGTALGHSNLPGAPSESLPPPSNGVNDVKQPDGLESRPADSPEHSMVSNSPNEPVPPTSNGAYGTEPEDSHEHSNPLSAHPPSAPSFNAAECSQYTPTTGLTAADGESIADENGGDDSGEQSMDLGE